MSLVEVRVSLERVAPTCVPQVRAFIDLQIEAGLGTETELSMRLVDDHTWLGCFTLARKHSRSFLYRLGLVAHSGVAWSVQIAETGTQNILLADGDTFDTAKCWLVGSCSAAVAEPSRRAAALSLSDRSRRFASEGRRLRIVHCLEANEHEA